MSSHLPRRIVILVHARDRWAERRPYQIWGIADVWRSWGIEVVVQHGTDRFVDADLVVNHLDLTVVPEPYVRHMARYAAGINRRCVDCSKRVVSTNLLSEGEKWDGPVIVKTNLNYGGALERQVLRGRLAQTWEDLRLRLSRRPWRIRRQLSTFDYPVLESVAQVPEDVWLNPHLVVERFLPEREGDLYVLRKLTLFGDRWTSRRSFSSSPIVKAGTAIRNEDVEPHPDVFEAARRLGLDRGKVDYVLHDGKAVVLDVNRTNTMGRSMAPERIREAAERLAPGLRSFWPPGERAARVSD
ncbi:MAG: hypothetical protein ACM3SU_05895 [Acidobacteriota bacterium]